MISFVLLLQVAGASAIAVPARPPLLPIRPTVPLVERPRGTLITDQSGAPFGVIDASHATMATILVGSHKVQVPANAIYKEGTRPTIAMTGPQLEGLLAVAARTQEAARPAVRATQPPKGFVEPPHIAPGEPTIRPSATPLPVRKPPIIPVPR